MLRILFRILIPAAALLPLFLGACTDASDDPIPVYQGEGVEKGDTAPDFTLLDPEGREVSLSDFRGKVVYVEFWATWCPYCMAAMPGLVRVWEDYRDDNFVMLGVSTDYREKDWREYLQENSDVSWPQVLDPIEDSGSPAVVYGVTGTPTSFLIDEEGVVREVHVGSVGEQKLREQIDALLAD